MGCTNSIHPLRYHREILYHLFSRRIRWFLDKCSARLGMWMRNDRYSGHSLSMVFLLLTLFPLLSSFLFFLFSYHFPFSLPCALLSICIFSSLSLATIGAPSCSSLKQYIIKLLSRSLTYFILSLHSFLFFSSFSPFLFSSLPFLLSFDAASLQCECLSEKISAKCSHTVISRQPQHPSLPNPVTLCSCIIHCDTHTAADRCTHRCRHRQLL